MASGLRRKETIALDQFDFVQFCSITLVRLVRKSNSQQNRCSILFGCRTQSNSIGVRLSSIGFFVRFCSIGQVGATSTAGERSFSTARKLKTWLRSRMNQERFSNLTVLNIHKERTDRLSTIDIANVFTDRNTNRKRYFGTFRVNDVQ